MTKGKFSIVIYLLSSILVIILSIFVYRLITHISYLANPDEVTISKYTGDRIHRLYIVGFIDKKRVL
ncbi:MAG: hypothetical protein ACI8WT_004795 [Clostridium sp.]|jgi:hypothetical protein